MARKRDVFGAFVYRASCEDCAWRLESRNGLAAAAVHHDQSGHTVHVMAGGSVTYPSLEYADRVRAWRRDAAGAFLQSAN